MPPPPNGAATRDGVPCRWHCSFRTPTTHHPPPTTHDHTTHHPPPTSHHPTTPPLTTHHPTAPPPVHPVGDAVRCDDAAGVGSLKLAELSPQLEFDRSTQQGTIFNHEGVRIAGAVYDPTMGYAMEGTELEAHPDPRSQTANDRLHARVLTVSVAGLEPRPKAFYPPPLTHRPHTTHKPTTHYPNPKAHTTPL